MPHGWACEVDLVNQVPCHLPFFAPSVRVSKGYAEKSEAPTDDGLDYNHSTAPLEKVMVVKLGLWQSTVIVHVLVAFGARRS